MTESNIGRISMSPMLRLCTRMTHITYGMTVKGDMAYKEISVLGKTSKSVISKTAKICSCSDV